MPAYRNGLEKKVAKTLGPEYAYEAIRLPYVIAHKYLPDFVDIQNKRIVECKGRFPSIERSKMKAVREAFPDWEIHMIFNNPDAPINKGSKTRYRDWCDKIGITWAKA